MSKTKLTKNTFFVLSFVVVVVVVLVCSLNGIKQNKVHAHFLIMKEKKKKKKKEEEEEEEEKPSGTGIFCW